VVFTAEPWLGAVPGTARAGLPAFERDTVLLPGIGPSELITLDNGAGMRARVLAFGATLIALEMPEQSGASGPIVLGFGAPTRYAGEHPCFGSTIGRCAGRIAHARFTLDGVEYALEQNDGEHHLHGGSAGFHRQPFAAEPFASGGACGVVLSRVSEHGESGYPGRVQLRVRYRLGRDATLRIDYEAVTDRPTILNLTHHSYFNLRDGGASDVLDHELWIAGEETLAIDDAGIPTGRIEPVHATALDFSTPRPIGERIDALQAHGGYNHCFLLPVPPAPGQPQLAARLHDPVTQRALELWTTQPALQLYTGNHLDGSLTGRGGTAYQRYAGVCLETQHPPDAPNQPDFGSVRLDPGARYAHSVELRFGVRESL
jgi:aldose 1-epimerase